MIAAALDIQRRQVRTPCPRGAKQEIPNVIDDEVVDLLGPLAKEPRQQEFDDAGVIREEVRIEEGIPQWHRAEDPIVVGQQQVG